MPRRSTHVTEGEYQRYRRLLQRTANLDLMVLKGHLLIEEQLQGFITAISPAPKFLKDARLTFKQTVCLVRALGVLPHDDSVWTFVASLNRLRNHLAHTPEPNNIVAAVDNILHRYWQDEFTKPTSMRQRVCRLRQAIALNIAFLNGFITGLAERHKRLLPPAAAKASDSLFR